MCNDDGLLESRAVGLTHPNQKTRSRLPAPRGCGCGCGCGYLPLAPVMRILSTGSSKHEFIKCMGLAPTRV